VAIHTTTTAAAVATTAASSQTTAASSGNYLVGYAPLSGSNGCDYTAPVTIDGEVYNLIIDSGSANFAVASSTCIDCTGITPEYTGPLTSTSVNLEYGSGSFDGVITDSLTFNFGGLSASMAVIAITNQSSFFTCENDSQGIMGIAYPTLAQSETLSLSLISFLSFPFFP